MSMPPLCQGFKGQRGSAGDGTEGSIRWQLNASCQKHAHTSSERKTKDTLSDLRDTIRGVQQCSFKNRHLCAGLDTVLLEGISRCLQKKIGSSGGKKKDSVKKYASLPRLNCFAITFPLIHLLN